MTQFLIKNRKLVLVVLAILFAVVFGSVASADDAVVWGM